MPSFANDRQSVVNAAFVGTVQVAQTMPAIPIRIARCIPTCISDDECQQLAVIACRNACIAMDVVRRRLDAKVLSRFLGPELIQRLRTFSEILHQANPPRGCVREELKHFPVTPRQIHGLVVGADKYEVSVCFSIGEAQYWANIVFSREQDRWRCSLLDLG